MNTIVNMGNDKKGIQYISSVSKTRLAEKIIEVIETRQLFLLPDLRVPDIAELLGTNRTYVHQAFRDNIGQSFTEIINYSRVEYAKQIMGNSFRKNIKLDLAQIRLQSGFSSESSFYRIFKQFTNTTPLKWIMESETKKVISI